MITVSCAGTPYEIGHQHGSEARKQVHGSLAFYKQYFLQQSKLEWEPVCAEAAKWLPLLEKEYPHYVEEMQGIADAVEVPLASIVALNVRTEVAFGLYNDGCTAVAYHSTSPDVGILAQNWDWKVAQQNNLIRLHIAPTTTPVVRPAIAIVTEAGIIGKIGLSGAGVGVCLNAIAALGVAHDRIPVHLALRAALDWSYELDAEGIAARLAERGVASAAHILISDAQKAVGLEVSAIDAVRVPPTQLETATAILHSNHYVVEHKGVTLAKAFLHDSPQRLARIGELVRTQQNAQLKPAANVQSWLCDEDGFPGSICRDESSAGGSATLFSIVMDLVNRRATVKEGKPNVDTEVYIMEPK